MLTKCTTHALIVIAFAAILRAQDGLTGVWEGETPNGASLTLTLTVKDSTLTGTVVRNGQSATISDGTVSKDNHFTFKVTLSEQLESVTGDLVGDEIKIWLDRQGPTNAVVLRRSTRK
jgi:hypothetical protein